MTDPNQNWEELCREFEAARDAHNVAYAAVTRGFARVAKGTGGNPTEQELDAYEVTSKQLEQMKRRMDDFVKANT